LADNLWAVDDEVPGLPGARRRMTIVRRGDSGLVFYNAVPLDERGEKAVRALGRPAALILPNRFHMLDATPFAAHFAVPAFAPAPALGLPLTPPGTAPITSFPADPAIELIVVDGFKTAEVGLIVRSSDGRASLVTGDVVTNAPHGPGFSGFMLRVVGFTGPAPRLPPPVRLRVMRNRAAVRQLLERLAQVPRLERIVPSHGEIFRDDAGAALRTIASSL
jgi:hypothetical protein